MRKAYREDEIAVHPIAKEYPLMDDAELAELAESIRLDGMKVRISLFRGEIADGRNRFVACCRHGVEIEDVSFVDLPDEWSENELRAHVEALNDRRRHESPEARQARRQKRVAAVAEDRRNGMSLPAIAEKHKVSLTQVQRDIKDAGLPGGKPAPPDGVVTGKDGKSYPASRPASTIADRLVERLERFADDLERRHKTPEREPGDDTDAIEEERRLEKSLPKPGSILFDWKAFESHYGELVRDVDKLGRAYRAKEGPCARGLREQLQRFHDAFEAWHKDLTGAAR